MKANTNSNWKRVILIVKVAVLNAAAVALVILPLQSEMTLRLTCEQYELVSTTPARSGVSNCSGC